MTPAVMRWVADMLDRHAPHDYNDSILEIGSRDVNGSIKDVVMEYAPTANYVGIDRQLGPSVDYCVNAAIPPDLWPPQVCNVEYGLVLYLEAMEHDPSWWQTLSHAHTVMSRDGVILVTTRYYDYPRHDDPEDYYRFSENGLRWALQYAGFEVVESMHHVEDKGVYAVGVK